MNTITDSKNSLAKTSKIFYNDGNTCGPMMKHEKILQLTKWWEFWHETKHKVFPRAPLTMGFKKDFEEIEINFRKACRRGDVDWLTQVMESKDFQQLSKNFRQTLVATGLGCAIEQTQLDTVNYLLSLKQYGQAIEAYLPRSLCLALHANDVEVMQALERFDQRISYCTQVVDKLKEEVKALCLNEDSDSTEALETLAYVFDHPHWNHGGVLDNRENIINASSTSQVEVLKLLLNRPSFTLLDNQGKQELLQEALLAACERGRVTSLNFLCFSKDLSPSACIERHPQEVLTAVCKRGNERLVQRYLGALERPAQFIDLVRNEFKKVTDLSPSMQSWLASIELNDKLQHNLAMKGNTHRSHKL